MHGGRILKPRDACLSRCSYRRLSESINKFWRDNASAKLLEDGVKKSSKTFIVSLNVGADFA